MSTATQKVEFSKRYVPSLAQWDVTILIDRSPRAFVTAGSEHAAIVAGQDAVRIVRANLEAGRPITEGL